MKRISPALTNHQRFRIVLIALLVLFLSSCSFPVLSKTEQEISDLDLTQENLANLPEYSELQAPTETPVAVPEAVKEEKFEVQQVSYFEDANGDTVFIGVIKNATDEPLDYSVVTIDLLSQDGEIIAENSDYTLLDVTFPSSRNAFKVNFGTDVPDWKSYSIRTTADDYFGNYVSPDLRIKNEKALLENDGVYLISGEILNDGDQLVEYVQVLVLLFDSQLDLISVDVASSWDSIIPVGKISPFSYTYDYLESDEVGRYELYVQGYRK